MNNTDPRKTGDELKQAQITNKTSALLQTIGDKNEANIVSFLTGKIHFPV